MPSPARIALLGLRPFEQRALESVLRLSAQRPLAYQLVAMPADADFLVVDAEDPGAVQLAVAAERLAETLFVGNPAPAAARAWAGRPIEPLQVLRELDRLASGEAAAAPGAAEAAGPGVGADPPSGVPSGAAADIAAAAIPAADRADDPAPPAAAAARAEPPGFAPVDLQEPPGPAPAAPPPPALPWRRPPEPAPQPGPPQALLVDDSDIALHFLGRLLQRHGLRCSMAATSTRALQLMARQHFAVAFIDVELGDGSDLDGLALCQHIRRQHPALGLPRPLLALVSAHDSPRDRVLGTLAGADAYFGKPLDDAALAHWLARQGLGAGAAARSARAS